MSEDYFKNIELYTRLSKKSPSLPYLPEETPKIFIEGEKSDIEKLFDKINLKDYDEAQDLFRQLNTEDKKLLISVCQDNNVRNKVLPKRREFYNKLCDIINRNFFKLVPDGIVEMIGDKLFDDKSKANLSLIRKDIHHTFSKYLNDLSKPHKPLTVSSILIDSNNYSVLLEENHIQKYKNLRNIKLDDDFNKTIELPDGLKKFEMGYKFNKDITLPEGLESFKMGDKFNKDITLPEGLESFEMGDGFNKDITLPEGLESFKMGDKFNKDIILPNSLEKFVMGYNFNLDINLYLEGLKYFKMGDKFNKYITLPLGLESFEMGDSFNEYIILPEGLESFEMGDGFNKDITLPEGLKSFKMGFMFNNSVTIPEGIETLIINVNFTEFINIPSSLEYLKIGKNPKKIKLNEINVNFVRLEEYNNKDLELIFYDNMYNKLDPDYQIIIEFTDSLRRGKDIDIKKYQYIQNNNSSSSVSDFYRLN